MSIGFSLLWHVICLITAHGRGKPTYRKLLEKNSVVWYDESITGLLSNPLVPLADFAKQLCHALDPFFESSRYANIILRDIEAGRSTE